MATTLALALYLPLLAAAAALVWRRPLHALYVLIPGLALHNLAMALLHGAGVRGVALTAVQAWKEILLAVAVARVATTARRKRSLPFRPGALDMLAFAFAAVALVYALVPQDVLGGEAGSRAVLLGLRHAWLPVAAYLLGRSLDLTALDRRRLAWTILGTAALVAAFGLVEEYTVSVERWVDLGVPAYYRDELGFDYKGPGRMPENFAFNTDEGIFRRLVSTFVSPLASAFLFAVALLVLAAGVLRHRAAYALGALVFAGLLFTISRSTILALAGGLVVLALVQRRRLPLAGAAAVVVAGLAFTATFPSFAPRTHFLPAEIAEQERIARERGGLPGDELSLAEPSIRSHLTSLRDGVRTVARHPQGYGLGNAGAVARRTDTDLKAGESNYTEIGVETGVVGLALFLAWNLGLLAVLARAGRADALAAALAASLATVLALALQTDVYGVPWLAFCLWWLGGTAGGREAAGADEGALHRLGDARPAKRSPEEAGTSSSSVLPSS